MSTLIAYNGTRAKEILCFWTPQYLLHEIRDGRFGSELRTSQTNELTNLLNDWMQRALGQVTLRDALWVDPRRGAQVYSLICIVLTYDHYQFPPQMSSKLALPECAELLPQQVRQSLQMYEKRAHVDEINHQTVEDNPVNPLCALLNQAEADGLTLVYHKDDAGSYPFPENLDTLLPPIPAPYQPDVRFEQPVGWRRAVAILLAILGVGLVGVPLLFGYVPGQPARLPLGLLTLALLLGIRASWPGYLGAFCFWLVPNLPTFHYGTGIAPFLLAIPLALLGGFFLWCDRQVRTLWHWLLRLRKRRS